LLMMVQGWRSYYWDDIVHNAPREQKGWDDAGLSVSGFVKRLLVNKPVEGGKIVLGPFSHFLLFEETKTDKNGRFKFDRLYISDTSQIILNAKNASDRANTEIIPDPVPPRDTVAPIADINKTVPAFGIPLQFYRKNYYRHLTEEAFIPDKGTIMLREVNVYAPKPEVNDLHFRLYPEPDKSLTVTEDDYTYSDIFDYLNGRVAGVMVTGETISIRNGGTPLFVLDGVICQNPETMVYTLHMQEIDKIEILKSGATTSYYGSRGGNGVIAIYTKHGDNKAVINQYIKGRIILRLNGFQKPNRFYSPKYTPENINSKEPDLRSTLFWSPNVTVKDGKAEVGFFSGDNLANYLVVVEGISKNGTIISGAKRFSVTGFNPALKK
jgi:TonB-dependent SusC/RagA subfamily outer membrane receptor